MKFGEAGCSDNILSALQGEICSAANSEWWLINVLPGSTRLKSRVLFPIAHYPQARMVTGCQADDPSRSQALT